MICLIMSSKMFAVSIWTKQTFVQGQQLEHKVWNMFAVENKDTRTTPLTSLILNVVNTDNLNPRGTEPGYNWDSVAVSSDESQVYSR